MVQGFSTVRDTQRGSQSYMKKRRVKTYPLESYQSYVRNAVTSLSSKTDLLIKDKKNQTCI